MLILGSKLKYDDTYGHSIAFETEDFMCKISFRYTINGLAVGGGYWDHYDEVEFKYHYLKGVR